MVLLTLTLKKKLIKPLPPSMELNLMVAISESNLLKERVLVPKDSLGVVVEDADVDAEVVEDVVDVVVAVDAEVVEVVFTDPDLVKELNLLKPQLLVKDNQLPLLLLEKVLLKFLKETTNLKVLEEEEDSQEETFKVMLLNKVVLLKEKDKEVLLEEEEDLDHKTKNLPQLVFSLPTFLTP